MEAETAERTALDIAEVLKGTEDDVRAVLGTATAAELQALHDAENDAKNDDAQKRKGVSAAIVGEQTARGELATEALTSARAAHEDAGKPLFVFHDEADFLAKDDADALRTRNAELETKLKATEDKAVKDAPKPVKAKRRQLKVSDKAAPEIAALAFADADGVTLKHYPDHPARPGQLKAERGGRSYQSEIIFDPGTGRGKELHRIFALDAKGKAIAECRLISPLPVGGANEARIPAGGIYFADWPKPVAAEAK